MDGKHYGFYKRILIDKRNGSGAVLKFLLTILKDWQ